MAESLVELATREGQNIIAQAITQSSSIVVANAGRAETAADRAEEAMARAESAGGSSEAAKREAVESAEQATLIYNSFLQQYGYPFTAATAADMTDTSKIYVYTGNETGYVNGNWYYHNGTAWVSGGVYNSTAFESDKTLTISGAAADAKVTGDIFDTFVEEFTFTETPGYFSSGGVINTPSSTYLEVYTDKKRVYPNEQILCRQSLSSSRSMWLAYCVWDEFDRIVQTRREVFVSGTTISTKIVLPERAYYITFCYRTFGESNTFTAKRSYAVVDSMLKNDFFDTNNEEVLIRTHTYTGTNNGTAFSLLRGVYKVDASNITDGKWAAVVMLKQDNEVIGSCFVEAGKSAYFYCDSSTYMLRFRLSSFADGDVDVLHLYRVGTPIFNRQLAITASKPHSGDVPIPNVVNGQYIVGGFVNSSTRICTEPFSVYGKFVISIADNETYKFACTALGNEEHKNVVFDSGWQTEPYTINVNNNGSFAVIMARNDETKISPSELNNIGLNVTSDAYWKKVATKEEVEKVSSSVVTVEDLENVGNRANIGSFSGRFKPCYDHLFVNKTTNAVIPHESLYHVRISHALGFNTIEANIAKTSDGVFFVNHLNGGKFGNYFHHVDGVTDISNISANSVTWDWIVENVRYNSTIPKYRTRPARLEEFLNECKQNNLIPFATSLDADAVAITEGIMGKDNYIAYNGTRENCPSAIIYRFYTSHTTKQDILDACESFGKPFIYGLGNPSDFTDANLQDVVDTLHEKGYWIGTSYEDTNWYKYSAMGFDFNGTQQLVNRIETGNLHNISSQFGFDNFTYTNAIEADDVLTFTSNGTISPTVEDTTYPVCMMDIEIWFDGTITIPSIGEFINATYTSDGTRPVFVSTPVINGSPKVTITANGGTKIFDIYYKSSVC